MTSGCPRSLQVATFSRTLCSSHVWVRLPPQSPSRYIPGSRGASGRSGPVAPAVSKSLHSRRRRPRSSARSGCPRSLQVATFATRPRSPPRVVRLPPQSPSRYIRRRRPRPRRTGPVAPAVSKSLHSSICRGPLARRSGCPRSLQVATFWFVLLLKSWHVRLPPQSPSRYIPAERSPPPAPRPVAPAVSKSLHSRAGVAASDPGSGCPRSLQVATFDRAAHLALASVRLPPQSPSRYIRLPGGGLTVEGPVAPAVSKSLHSPPWGRPFATVSGCPRSLQVATFGTVVHTRAGAVRLPPQSPSRYIPASGVRE